VTAKTNRRYGYLRPNEQMSGRLVPSLYTNFATVDRTLTMQINAIDPAKTAMIVVDMQNDFVATGAPMEAPASISPTRSAG